MSHTNERTPEKPAAGEPPLYRRAAAVVRDAVAFTFTLVILLEMPLARWLARKPRTRRD